MSYYNEHRAKRLAQKRRYYRKHKARIAAYYKAWYAKNGRKRRKQS